MDQACGDEGRREVNGDTSQRTETHLAGSSVARILHDAVSLCSNPKEGSDSVRQTRDQTRDTDRGYRILFFLPSTCTLLSPVGE